MKPPFSIIATFAMLTASLCFGADETRDRESHRFFEMEIRPLLAENCYSCHDAEKQKGSLRLDHLSWMLRGGDSGPALVPGKPEESLLMEAVRRLDPDFAMPPKQANALPADQIAKLERWIALGAPWPEDPQVEVAEETDENGFTASDRAWWAVQPVLDPDIPHHGSDWAKNAIDHFIARKLEAAKIAPAAPASKTELVRRAYFDLHGLPPTPEQAEAFVNDARPDAWERLIDELLASPTYGERWAQHWLDVVRYAESDGYRGDHYRDGAWRYRDYVIRSLNQDKPYSDFIREQLAGDEVNPEDPDSMIATAFLRLGIYEWNQRDVRVHWDIIMTEMTNATAEAFLGLGIGCAQCHDHKFDPILQKDHFALQAFLNTVWRPESRLLGTREQLDAHAQSMAKWEAATADIRSELQQMKQPKLDLAQKNLIKQFPDDVQPIYYKPQAERTAYEEQLVQLMQGQVTYEWKRVNWEKHFENDKEALAKYKALTKKLKAFDHLKPKPLPKGLITTDVKPTPAQTFLKTRGKDEVVEPAFLTLLGQKAPNIQPGKTTTGRRAALADWIASADNPLSTRVITNRVWQYHFARGLAPSPNDFGKLGGKPTHPELLDWLTTRFIEDGWSLKKLHRRIMTSATYQQTAHREPGPVEKQVDPANDLLWRYLPKRLQAEQVRDAMLAVSKELSKKASGPPESGTGTSRSVYTRKIRNSPDPFLASFDAPAGFASAPDRIDTTTPSQSLMLVNGQWAMDRAKGFAKRLVWKREAVDPGMIQLAFQLAYQRAATQQEVEASMQYLQAVMDMPIAPPRPEFSDESGLRDITGHFSKVTQFLSGKKAIRLRPGSRFERFDFSSVALPDSAFTIEAVAYLNTMHKDASVNTLVSKWSGNHHTEGWAFSVTSEKSRYQPLNVVLQLVGKDFQSNRIYEPLISNLRFPLKKPGYMAAAISAQPTDGDVTAGKATFYVKDLTEPGAALQKAELKHGIVQGFAIKNLKSLIGGRDGKGHMWDGQVARLKISKGALTEQQLFVNGGETDSVVVDLNFISDNGEEPVKGTAWHRTIEQQPASRLLRAATHFCHALLNSNEFLYLH